MSDPNKLTRANPAAFSAGASVFVSPRSCDYPEVNQLPLVNRTSPLVLIMQQEEQVFSYK